MLSTQHPRSQPVRGVNAIRTGRWGDLPAVHV